MRILRRDKLHVVFWISAIESTERILLILVDATISSSWEEAL